MKVFQLIGVLQVTCKEVSCLAEVGTLCALIVFIIVIINFIFVMNERGGYWSLSSAPCGLRLLLLLLRSYRMSSLLSLISETIGIFINRCLV